MTLKKWELTSIVLQALLVVMSCGPREALTRSRYTCGPAVHFARRKPEPANSRKPFVSVGPARTAFARLRLLWHP